LKGLRKKLDKAVAEEDFEQAARLRDEIKQASGKAGNVAAT
jgi:protein-arginine kinase activator protein McsA